MEKPYLIPKCFLRCKENIDLKQSLFPPGVESCFFAQRRVKKPVNLFGNDFDLTLFHLRVGTLCPDDQKWSAISIGLGLGSPKFMTLFLSMFDRSQQSHFLDFFLKFSKNWTSKISGGPRACHENQKILPWWYVYLDVCDIKFVIDKCSGCSHMSTLLWSHWELVVDHAGWTSKLGTAEELAPAHPSVHYHFACMGLGSCIWGFLHHLNGFRCSIFVASLVWWAFSCVCQGECCYYILDRGTVICDLVAVGHRCDEDDG